MSCGLTHTLQEARSVQGSTKRPETRNNQAHTGYASGGSGGYKPRRYYAF
jgi:hypothetical protein